VYLFANVALLVAGYRISYELRPGQAALLGLGGGILMAINQWLWMSIHGMRLFQVAAIALAEVVLLVPSYALSARRSGILLTLLNVAVVGAAAIILPYFVLDWVGR